MSEAFETPAMSIRLGFFVDPACPWSWLTSRWLVQVAPQRDLDVQWRPDSLLLRDGTHGLEDWKVAIRTASHRAVRVMAALHRDDPAAVPRFYEALLPRTFAAVNVGGPPFAELEGALLAAELAPSYAAAADDGALDEPIRQSMAEAFAAAGGVVGTPTMVLYQDPPAGFLGPVVAAPPTGADALRLWDAVRALAAGPGVLELSRPRPPHPEVPGLRLPQT
jgi:2-hydroxychromene-2-carboxylate isomerase